MKRILFLLLLCCSFTSAQPSFTPTNGPPGGEVTKLYHFPQLPYLYAATISGLYRYNFTTQTWTYGISCRYLNYIYDIAYSPSQSVLYATTSDTIFRSINGGDTWQPLGSTNGLATWQNYNSIRENPLNQQMYTTGIYCTSNQGNTWNPLDTNFQQRVRGTYLAFDSLGTLYASGGDTVYASTNNGASWTSRWTGTTLPIFVVSARDSDAFYGLASGDVYRTTDRGASWTRFAYFPFEQITAIDFSGDEIFVGTYGNYGNAYRTTNLGASWERLYHSWAMDNVNSIVRYNATTLFIGTAFGVLVSNDNGTHWNSLNTGLTANRIMCFTVSPNGSLYQTGWFGLYRRDGITGAWTLSDTAYSNSYANIICISNQIVLTCGARGIRKSTDSGITWRTTSFAGIYTDQLTQQRNGWITTNTDNSSYISVDSGDSWSRISMSPIVSIYIHSNGVFSGGHYDSLPYKVSYDSGRTWIGRWVDPLFHNHLRKHYVDELDRVYLAGLGTLYSTNVGVSWQTSQFPNNEEFYVEDLIQLPDNRFLCATRDQIFVSNNRAQSWELYWGTLSTSSIRYLGVDASGYLYYATNEHGIYRSAQPILGVHEHETPTFFQLAQNYPNPFNSTTNIKFTLTIASPIQLCVFNTLGQLVSRQQFPALPPGDHVVPWHSGELSSGVYIYQIESNGVILSRNKMTLMK